MLRRNSQRAVVANLMEIKLNHCDRGLLANGPDTSAMNILERLRNVDWRSISTRQVVVAVGCLVLVFAVGFSLVHAGLAPEWLAYAREKSALRTGMIRVVNKDDNVCKEMKFDNETSLLTAVTTAACYRPPVDTRTEQEKLQTGSHLDSIREGFRKR